LRGTFQSYLKTKYYIEENGKAVKLIRK